MSKEKPPQKQLPLTSAIDIPSNREFGSWFEYPVRVQPHHTDYAGIAWHGTYVAWMEEARVEFFRSIGVEFADLVALGCDLPVVELSIRYHQAIRLGMAVIVRTRVAQMTGVRMNWEHIFVSTDGKKLYTTATVTLVALDRERGKIMRQPPANIQDALTKVAKSSLGN